MKGNCRSALPGQGSLRIGPAPLSNHLRGLLFEPANVFFDDTLWRRRLFQVVARAGLHTHYRCFFRLWDRDGGAEVFAGRSTFRDALGRFLRSAGLAATAVGEVMASCRAEFDALNSPARALPGAVKSLDQLHRRGWLLAAAANSTQSAVELRRQWLNAEIGDSLGALVTSRDCGVALPDAEVLITACRAMGLPREAVAVVSNESATLASATQLGMTTIAFNAEPDVDAQHSFACFCELLAAAPCRPLSLAVAG